jgi:hypothetical protein
MKPDFNNNCISLFSNDVFLNQKEKKYLKRGSRLLNYAMYSVDMYA